MAVEANIFLFDGNSLIFYRNYSGNSGSSNIAKIIIIDRFVLFCLFVIKKKIIVFIVKLNNK